MSRAPLPSPPLTNLPFAAIQALANDLEPTERLAPKEWFERAKYEADKALIAERKGKKEEMWLAYTKSCACYTNCKSHPAFKDVKSDPHLAVRIKDFKDTFESFLGKAKALKIELKNRPIEAGNGPPTPSQPETSSMGSIADRMKALSGNGMNVGFQNKRLSKDLASSQPSQTSQSSTVSGSNKSSQVGGMSVTGGAGNFGPARYAKGGSDVRALPTRPPTPPREDVENPMEFKQPVNEPSTKDVEPGIPTEDRPDPITTEVVRPTEFVPPPQPSVLTSPPMIEPSRPVEPSRPLAPTYSGDRVIEPNRLDAAHRPLPPPRSPGHPPPPQAADDLDNFANAFPSLSEFGKQFESDEISFKSKTGHSYPFERTGVSGLPNGHSEGKKREDNNEPSFPDLPSFPILPSVPTSRPGLPVPSSNKPSPPSPDLRGIPRPTSAPAPTDKDVLSTSPAEQIPHAVLKSPPQSTMPTPPPLSFPMPIPTPQTNGKSHSAPVPAPIGESNMPQFEKPKFPFTNAIDPDTLRTYFLNPTVEMLLLDIRSEEEYSRGHVGREYEARGAKVNVVWLDPTVLMRHEMNGTKLEDSLSLSSDRERRAFERRNSFDLVVFYDSHSVGFPKGGPPSPLSRAWEIIYQNEFTKRLNRTPVLLTGGYAAWIEFIKMRMRRHANGHSTRPYNPKSSVDLTSRPRSNANGPSASADLSSKRVNRDMPVYQSSQYAKNLSDSFNYGPQSMTGESSYTGRHQSVPSRQIASPVPSRHTPSNSLSSYAPGQSTIASPPQASIHPGPGARRRSDYVEQHNQTYSGYSPTMPQINSRSTIDYPQAHALSHVPPPPPVASHALERDSRPSVPRTSSLRSVDVMATNGDDVRYWGDVALGLTGLKNLGNTCYMNSTIQCLSATYPFTRYFLDGRYKRSINIHNPLGTKGNLANAFAELIGALWQESYAFLSPITFRKSIITFAQQFSGTDQHDSQEFLSFVLDGLHEDLNRIQHKPPPVEMTPSREAELEVLPPEVASEKEWKIYKERNDSLIVDLFQGQYRNRLECLTCHKTSTTYDAFMYMSLPVPAGKSGVVLQELIDEFVKSEIMQNEDAWNCPRCKVPRRATKTLTIARLPPVLLIQLKRFSTKNGVFWDKSDTPVVFPIRQLDLSRYVPPRHPSGREDLDDPRTQIGPWKYDLYGVSNHMGTLSSGHYTAFVKSSKGWNYCEDSKVSRAQEHDVLTKPAYILFYKRVRA